MKFWRTVLMLFCTSLVAYAADHPAQESTFVVKDFQLKSGERLPQVNLHYYTLGSAKQDSGGKMSNAVLILHGTGGSGRQYLTDNFAGVLSGPGHMLDTAKY